MQEFANNEASLKIESDQMSLVFVHSPFCGTCHLARKMLSTLEALFDKGIFYEMNASLHPDLMERYKIKSVPCLLVAKNGEILEKIYAFQSVPYLHERIVNYVKQKDNYPGNDE
ncbi:thioredoxin family protein [Halobacillus litoralis]|uniref:thioredoxin family protein n=1 Tax=Halobacillus litoralis TaxID=45668 RepID=UPI001CFED3E0|nr:thioredoxin family protein [Halobacillus litoralis]